MRSQSVTEITVEQKIGATPSTVYRYLTESDLWSKWQGSTATLDPRDGGIFSLLMPNGMTARGQFTELVPESKVVFTWGWVDRPGIPPGSTVVSIDLVPEDDGTRLVLTHSNLPESEAPQHRTGWEQHLANLAEVARPALS